MYKFRFAETNNDYSEICLTNNEISWQRVYALAPQLNGIRQAKFPTLEQLQLEIIQDGAIVEIWLNGGLVTLSGYVYSESTELLLSIPDKNFSKVLIDYAQIA